MTATVRFGRGEGRRPRMEGSLGHLGGSLGRQPLRTLGRLAHHHPRLVLGPKVNKGIPHTETPPRPKSTLTSYPHRPIDDVVYPLCAEDCQRSPASSTSGPFPPLLTRLTAQPTPTMSTPMRRSARLASASLTVSKQTRDNLTAVPPIQFRSMSCFPTYFRCALSHQTSMINILFRAEEHCLACSPAKLCRRV